MSMNQDDFNKDAEKNRNIDMCELNDLIVGTPEQSFRKHIKVDHEQPMHPDDMMSAPQYGGTFDRFDRD